MAGNLEGPLAKVERAHGQFVVLKNEVESVWPPMEPWPVRREEHRGGFEYRFYLLELPGIDPSWALLAGEIMFNLRSALDHLAFQLHERRYGGAIPPEVEGKTEFPIYRRRDLFVSSGQRRIARLDEADRWTVKHFQPYNAGKDDDDFLARDALWNLQSLHVIDKHRQLHVVASAHRFAVQSANYPDTCGFLLHPNFGPAKSHDHIDTWTFTSLPPNVEEHSGACLQVVVESGARTLELVVNIEAMIRAVATVLRRFANRFEAPQSAPGTFYADWPWRTS